MKFISWNVNGLRAVVKKNFEAYFINSEADFFCLQETKLQEGQIDLSFPSYHSYWNYADRKGYSGTAIFTKHEPLSVRYGIEQDEHNHEGRVITLEYANFYLVTVYTPNSKQALARLEYRIKWEHDLTDYLVALKEQKPVILCGDLNVAHKEIDLKNPKNNRHNPGFSDDERHCFSYLLAQGFTDSFRHFYPDLTGAYSWWSYRFNARANNAGWRIDYFLVSDALKSQMTSATIHADVLGSDHCPVELDIDVTANR
ncbi:exodeoxyribonuclease III [Brochothrix campestris]|uniref:exodeoxyribonuclease III n=1 Tax=Brochothrix campestris TaxID=2757 RepID=UPI0038CF4923